MKEDTIITLTFKKVEHILTLGGSASWKINPTRAKDCKYVICTRNKHSGYKSGDENHGSAFLIGKISGVSPTNERSIPHVERFEENFAGRQIIRISHYALINKPNIYPGNRQGFAYTSIDTLGIDPEALDWREVPHPNQHDIDTYNRFHTDQRLSKT
jgi:hypothetical protein